MPPKNSTIDIHNINNNTYEVNVYPINHYLITKHPQNTQNYQKYASNDEPNLLDKYIFVCLDQLLWSKELANLIFKVV